MRSLARKAKFSGITALGVVLLFGALGSERLQAQSPEPRYPRMAPIQQYLMGRKAEIALARSAAPESISRDATVLVLGRHGYETAVRGKNGFVCLVERGWVGAAGWPEAFNPKIRGADCLNPPAAESILPFELMRTKMLLAGHSNEEISNALRAAIKKGELPTLEPGAMSYMMAKGSYLTDEGYHNVPHLMFFVALDDPAAWGAGMPGSPVGSVSFWFFYEKPGQELKGFPPMRTFTVRVSKWSDGSPAPHNLLP